MVVGSDILGPTNRAFVRCWNCTMYTLSTTTTIRAIARRIVVDLPAAVDFHVCVLERERLPELIGPNSASDTSYCADEHRSSS